MVTKLLTPVEVGDLLTIHPKTAMRLASRGELPGFRVGRYWRFDPGTISRWIAEKSQRGVDKTGNGTLVYGGQPCPAVKFHASR